MSALPQTAAEERFNLRGLIRREEKKVWASEGSSKEGIDLPSLVAEKALPKVPVDAKIEWFDHHFRELVSDAIRQDRSLEPANAQSVKAAGKVNQRWTSSVFTQSFSLAHGSYKQLGAFTIEDCYSIAEAYAERKRQNGAMEKRFKNLAGALESSGASVARDVPVDVVRGLGF